MQNSLHSSWRRRPGVGFPTQEPRSCGGTDISTPSTASLLRAGSRDVKIANCDPVRLHAPAGSSSQPRLAGVALGLAPSPTGSSTVTCGGVPARGAKQQLRPDYCIRRDAAVCDPGIGPPLAAGLERFRLSDDITRKPSQRTPAIVPQQESERSGIHGRRLLLSAQSWSEPRHGSRTCTRRLRAPRDRATTCEVASPAFVRTRNPG